MRAVAILFLCAALCGCPNFDQRYNDCVASGRCQTGDGGGTGGDGGPRPFLAGGATIDFGAVAVGDSPTRPYSFVNDGGAPTEPITFLISDGGVFAIAGVGCGNISLNPTAACMATLSASPNRLGTLTGSLFIDGGAGTGLTVMLQVQGIAPLTVGPSPESFGNVQVGRDAFRSFTVTNFSTQARTLALNVTNDQGGDFFLGDGGTCVSSLPGANSCTVEVRFNPTGPGQHDGTLEIVPGVTASFTGTGRAPGALDFGQGELDFGIIDAGSTITQSLMLTNTGGTPSGPISFAVVPSSPVFSFDAGTCTSGLNGGATCSVSITFRPLSAGDKQAALEASYGSDLTPLQLEGTGRVERTLTVISDGGTIGFDSPSGVTCPTACTQVYEETSSPQNVTLQDVMPNPGLAVSSFTGCQQVGSDCTVLMDRDRSVTVNYVPQLPRLFLTTEPGGSAAPVPAGISCGPGCYDFTTGTNVTVNATAQPGYAFGGFAGDCSGAECRLVMNGTRTVTAGFNGPHNFVFVTTTALPSTLVNTPGLNGICANEAADAGLPSQNWRAWISRNGVDIRDEASVTSARGWVRVDGRPFAESLPVDNRGAVLYPPMLTARGLPASPSVWTGTNELGLEAENCTNWASDAGGVTAVAGSVTGGSFRWTSDFQADCSSMLPVVCLGTTQQNSLSVPQPPANARMIFVTGMEYPISDAMAANANCRSEASAAMLPGTWTAVLALSTSVGASALPNTQEPLYRLDGVLVALHSADLRSGAVLPLAPIEVTPDGRHVDGAVWTGSSGPAAQASGKNCDDWANTSAMGAIIGSSAESSERWWTLGGTLRACSDQARFYCVR